MISLTAMLFVSTLGPATPIGDVEPKTPAEQAAELVKVSGPPATTLETRAVLSLGDLYVDESTLMTLRYPRYVRPRHAGKLPLRARIDGTDGAMSFTLGMAKGRRYLVDCTVEAEGKLEVSTEVGDGGAIDSADRYFTRRPKDGHIEFAIARQPRAIMAVIMFRSKKPWTLTRCEIAPDGASSPPPEDVPPAKENRVTTEQKRLKLAKKLIDASVVESQLLEPTVLGPRRAAIDADTYMTFEWPYVVHPDLVGFAKSRTAKAGWAELHFRSAPDRDYLIACELADGAPDDVVFEAEASTPSDPGHSEPLAKGTAKLSAAGVVSFAVSPPGILDVSVTMRMNLASSWALRQCEVTPVQRAG